MKPLLYEWRSYIALPGMIGPLSRHLQAVRSFSNRHGLTTLGVWTEEIGAPGNLSCLWRFESLDGRAKSLDAWAHEPEWREHVASGQAESAMLDHVESVLWAPTAYSPEPRISSRLVELRQYDATPGRLQDVHDRFANHTLRLFERHGMENCGFWTEYFGHSERLVYMLGFESLAHREQAWKAFGRDAEWRSARLESERNGPLIAHHTSRILNTMRDAKS